MLGDDSTSNQEGSVVVYGICGRTIEGFLIEETTGDGDFGATFFGVSGIVVGVVIWTYLGT